jgi:hypothetical protein
VIAARRLRPRVRRVLAHNALFDAMCDATGLQPARGLLPDRGRAFAQARTACLPCPNARACEAWLAMRGKGIQPGAAPPFCPNRAFFERAAACGRADGSEPVSAPVSARG